MVYALVVAASPLLHHDLECHVKMPAHCGACTQGPGASRLEAGFALEQPRLQDLGEVESGDVTQAPHGVAQERVGRAPPA